MIQMKTPKTLIRSLSATVIRVVHPRLRRLALLFVSRPKTGGAK